MLELELREEFKGKKIKGTMVDFTNRQGTGALDRSTEDFLNITYPSVDLLKTIEALQPGRNKPVVIIGARGQGKSHLMAALAHMYQNESETSKWLSFWGRHLHRNDIQNLTLDRNVHVITESLHQHNYTFLWDLLFDQHPEGKYIKGKWEGQGKNKTEVPGTALLLEMFQKKPTVLILDESQTWYASLTNTKQYPRRNWASNFIQILSEIAAENPESLSLVLSVRDGNADIAQQVYRIGPERIDFKGPEAKQDRQKLLLYRIFKNRMLIPNSKIENLIDCHLSEFFRLFHIPGSEQEKHKNDYVQSWPYSPLLMTLLDDQVLIATYAQETRDLLRILVDVFKNASKENAILTPADFSIIDEKSGATALLDSVANQLHRDLKTKAIRNYDSVKAALEGTSQKVPNLEPMLSSLWLRSLSLENIAGARPFEIQLDVTKNRAVDDNLFAVELETIKENSFNIHQKGDRLVFLNEENPQAKLMVHAKNDKLFESGKDIEYLATEIRYVLGGSELNSSSSRVIVLKQDWQKPWDNVEEKELPDNWDNRVPYVVIPTGDVKEKELGEWLQKHIARHRNTVRFILARAEFDPVFYDKPLLVLARAVSLAKEWKTSDPNYSELFVKYQKELRERLRSRFDRFAVLDTWNFAQPDQCTFEINSHKAEGEKILPAIHEKIKKDLFLIEEFEELVLKAAQRNDSIYSLLEQLKEPMIGGTSCIPWLGEVDSKEYIYRLCAKGKIEINLQGRETLSRKPGESEDSAWQRIKGKIGSGRILTGTFIHEPDNTVSSGGGVSTDRASNDQGISNYVPDSRKIENVREDPPPAPRTLFGRGSYSPTTTSHSADNSSSLSLLGKMENWGINTGTKVSDIQISVTNLNGAQLQDLLKKLPDGVTYGLTLKKEEE